MTPTPSQAAKQAAPSRADRIAKVCIDEIREKYGLHHKRPSYFEYMYSVVSTAIDSSTAALVAERDQLKAQNEALRALASKLEVVWRNESWITPTYAEISALRAKAGL